MTWSLVSLRRGWERLLAIVIALAVFTGLMVVYASPAQAHHPTISAGQTCVQGDVVVAYESVSWRTDGGSGSDHPDIRIEVRVNGAGDWTEVGSGAYTEANNYRFSGTFDADLYWGDSIEVRARANGPWGNGVGGGEIRTTESFTVDQDCFNPSCPAQYLQHKVDPVTAGTHATFFTISNIQDSGSGPTFDWSSTLPVYQVIVKGGPGANIYDYSGATSDSGLHAPQNPKNSKWYGLSHVTFCYGEETPDEVTVSVETAACAVGTQGLPAGNVSFSIDPASGATVAVFSDPGLTSQVGGPLGDGDPLSLPPGDYYWVATAGDGFELEGEDAGEFTIDPCDASVMVSFGDCELDDQGLPVGEVTVSIDPESGATVVVSGPGGPYQFDGSGGSVDLPPGNYTWVATAGDGFELEGEDAGEFTIDPCDASVIVVAGQCEPGADPVGTVTVFIATESGASVTILDETSTQVAQFDGTGGSVDLPPGTYTWAATPGDGFQFPPDQVTGGTFTIDPCDATVLVTHGHCDPNTDSAFGSVTVVIDPASGATVTVSGADGDHVFSGTGGSTELAAGPYTWSAEAAEGFSLIVAPSGAFTVEACDDDVLSEVIENDGGDPGTEVGNDQVEDEILDVEILPFTGRHSDILWALGMGLVGAGMMLVGWSRRRVYL